MIGGILMFVAFIAVCAVLDGAARKVARRRWRRP